MECHSTGLVCNVLYVICVCKHHHSFVIFYLLYISIFLSGIICYPLSVLYPLPYFINKVYAICHTLSLHDIWPNLGVINHSLSSIHGMISVLCNDIHQMSSCSLLHVPCHRSSFPCQMSYSLCLSPPPPDTVEFFTKKVHTIR